MFGLKNDEIFTCFLLIIIGYTIAKMFSRRYEGFSVGGVRGAFPLCPSDGTKVDACFAYSDNCDKLYTHTIGNESDYSVHTCKKGGLLNGYRCISTGNKCVFPGGHDCQEPADCESNVCENGKCAPSSPPPPRPSCSSDQEYCQNQNICVNKCRSGERLTSQCSCLPKCCINQTCTDPNECKP